MLPDLEAISVDSVAAAPKAAAAEPPAAAENDNLAPGPDDV